MTLQIHTILAGLDSLADELAASRLKPGVVKFLRWYVYQMRTNFHPAKIWYSPVDCTDMIASPGTTISHLWDSAEEFFDEADWVDYGDIMKMNRSMDISPVWGVVLPTARNEDGTVVAYDTRIFSSLEEATAVRDEAMKENDQ
jgi:hypothetical protein